MKEKIKWRTHLSNRFLRIRRDEVTVYTRMPYICVEPWMKNVGRFLTAVMIRVSKGTVCKEAIRSADPVLPVSGAS
jgi:hypothetical protein